jgi:large subunit ribosomal protein L15
MMALNNLQPATGSTKRRKIVGRGQGSGMGKTATRGNKGQKSRTGYKVKRNFEGGQQPLARRLPKIGFTSRVVKPTAINVDTYTKVASLDEITVESVKKLYKLNKSVTAIKLIGSGAKALADKIKDEKVTYTNK